MARRDALFTTIRTEGGLLPTDLLALIAQGDKSVPGVATSDYHLAKGEQFGTRITDAWNRLRVAWKDFSSRLASMHEEEIGTTVTRDRWLLVLFEVLGYGRLPTQRALTVDGKDYPISHGWSHVPIHLVSAKLPIDRRSAGVKGAAGASPHSMVQELLNRSENNLWAFVSNGRVLRLLRDNASLTRQAFVEFDLEAMFSDEVYEDFVVLWRTCHQSRVEADNPADCWLEQWTKVAAETGTRARVDLRGGVEAAIEALGTGFVAHPANTVLKERLRSGDLDSQDLYRQLLRVIYRLLFLFVAEDRNLLHPPDAPLDAQRRYARFYSLNRIRGLAARRRGGPHPDLWSSLTVVFNGLGQPDGIPALALPGLGSFLWSDAACPDLDRAQIANQHLLAAVRHIGYVEDRNERVLRPIDYRNLGTEELGAIYESLLEQHPEVNTDAGTFNLNTAAGHERKTTGSYYTPTSLITELLDSAVDPVLDKACGQPNSETALLDLAVVDPACGSGHFLLAAAHRIAKRLAAVRTGDDEPSPDATRTALRDVIACCIYGIDLNPMAVELCKVSLWLESMEPGKPLGFLDHRIVRGNGLIGATPELLDAGVPDDAFKPLTGDDKATVNSLKKRNKHARSGQQGLFTGGVDAVVGQIADRLAEIDQINDNDLTAVTTKAQRWSELVSSPDYKAAVHAADTWCAAFVAPKTPAAPAVTHDEYITARDNANLVQPDTRRAVDALAEQHAFLHWHLAFPDIYARGGFDLVLGNPPWLSYSGRQQVPIDPAALHFLKVVYPAISSWPASHSAFVLQGLRQTRVGGRMGMVLPFQLSELALYEPVREAILRLASAVSVTDAGEEVFEGVSQRVGLLVVERGEERDAHSRLSFAAIRRSDVDGASNAARATLLGRLETLPRLPSATFADPGVHTGNVSKKIILSSFDPRDSRVAGVREGRDISAFSCRQPAKGLLFEPVLGEGEYCRIQRLDRYESVPILLRQTADRPIACRHVDRTYFRNSLLACMGVPGVDDAALVGILNSDLIHFWYRSVSSDSGQRTFPQVKVGVLRQLPFVCETSQDLAADQIETLLAIAEVVKRIEVSIEGGGEPTGGLLDDLNRLVLSLYGISAEDFAAARDGSDSLG